MTLFLFIILLILLTYLGVLNLKDGKKPFQNSQKTKTEKTKIRQFFTTQESLDLAQETCQEFGIYFINEISTKTKIDDQIWNFKSILKNTNFEKLLEIYSLKEEKLKFQVETIFKSYQNDWMSQKILETEIYTTKNYQNELWQIYQEQMGMDKRDIILNPKILDLAITEFDQEKLEITFQVNMETINFKIWEYKKDNLTKEETENQGRIASGSAKVQKCTEFWVFQIDNSTNFPKLLLNNIYN